jgi:tetratricopeptide (TPR) repeat protein
MHMSVRRLFFVAPFILSVGCTSIDKQPLTREDNQTKPDTLVTLGDVRADAAQLPNRPTHEKDRLNTEALQAYQNALSRDAKNVKANVGMARVYTNMSDKEKSVNHYQIAIKLAPSDASLWYEQGTMYGKFKDWNNAVESLKQATALASDNRTYKKMLGMTLARAGRVEEGYGVLASAMPVQEARYTLAKMMHHMNETERAKEQLALALRAQPDYQPAKELLQEVMTPGGNAGAIQQTSFQQLAQ